MDGNISIDPGRVAAAAKEIEEHAITYNREIEQIYSTIDELRQAWQGSSAERFVKDIDKYREEFEMFGTQLNNFSDILKASAGDFQKLEDGEI